jgi:hypothetical protein
MLPMASLILSVSSKQLFSVLVATAQVLSAQRALQLSSGEPRHCMTFQGRDITWRVEIIQSFGWHGYRPTSSL